MILLKFGTEIKGASQVKDHKDWIPFETASFTSGRHISLTSAGAKDRETGPGHVSELTLSKGTDMSSPDLFMQSVCGKSLGKATVHVLQTGGQDKTSQPYVELELEDAIISHYSVSMGAGRPTEHLQLNFTKISYKYNAFDGASIKTGTPKVWNLVEQTQG